MSDTAEDVIQAWRSHAPELAAWTLSHMVNRADVWGAYYEKSRRTDRDFSYTAPAIKHRGKSTLSIPIIERHYAGRDESHVIGLHTTSPENTCRFLCLDIDHHGDDDAAAAAINFNAAKCWYDKLVELGFSPLLEDSNGKGGIHLWNLFKSPAPSEVVYSFAKWIVRDFKDFGLKSTPEVFPKQRNLEGMEYGNWTRLPGRHHTKDHWSRLYSFNGWNEGKDAVDILLAAEGDDPNLIPKEAIEQPEAEPPASTIPAVVIPDCDDENVERLTDLEIAERCVAHIRNSDFLYDDWYPVGAAIKSVDSGLYDLFRRWSAKSSKHNEAICRKKWDSFKRETGNRAAIGTLIHLARKDGYDVFNRASEFQSRERRAPQAAFQQYTPTTEQTALTPATQAAPTSSQAKTDPPKKDAAKNDAPPMNRVVLSAGQLCKANRRLRPAVIEGILRQGEIGNLIASPKARKSFLAMALGLCVASGKPWLGRFATTAGDVLLIDNELHEPTLADRLVPIANSLDIKFEDYHDKLHILSLRGCPCNLNQLDSFFRRIEHGKYGLIVLDALYRMVPPEFDENSNAAMTALYGVLDKYAAITGSAFIVVHHASKGAQGNKSVTDTGAGAGAQSRAADAHIVLREHEEQDCVVFDAVVRSWKPISPLALRWQYPLWRVDDLLDVTRLRKENGKGGRPRSDAPKAEEKPADEPWTPERFVSAFIAEKPRARGMIETYARRQGIKFREIQGLLFEAEASGLCFSVRNPNSNLKLYTTSHPVLDPDDQ